MLNPSTANEVANDPTVERCERRAREWGYGRLDVVNLFAFRSTDPKALYSLEDPVGPDNDRHILESAASAGRLICAWGVHGALGDRGEKVLDMLHRNGEQPHALAITVGGHPRHPLYLPYSLKPVLMQ